MPAKEFVKKIGKHDYKYVQMTMTPALELLSLLSAFVGEALAPFAKGGLDADPDKEIDPNVVAQCVHALMQKFGQSEGVLEIVNRLNARGIVVIGTEKQKVPLDLGEHADAHFGEHLGELPGWLAFALGAQFGPFFESLGGGKLAAAARKKMLSVVDGSKNPSTSESAGQSSA